MNSYRDNCHSKSKAFAPLNPHFRKTIEHAEHLNDKLRIPREFSKKHGRSLSSTMLLRLPNGSKFEIGLLKSVDDVWLQKGWPEFVETNSLRITQTLFFRLEGKSVFHVVIVDVTGSEVEYPTIALHKRTVDDRKHKREIVFSDEYSDFDDDKEERSRKKMKTEFGEYTSEEPNISVRTRSLTPQDKAQALLRTRDFTSQNPHFKIVIQRTHVLPRYDMTIPQEFWRVNLMGNSGQNVTLYVSHGKTWLVKPNPRKAYAFLCGGWKEFAKDNDLNIGDVCIFELLSNHSEILFKVSINRNVDQETQVKKFGIPNLFKDQSKRQGVELPSSSRSLH